MISQPESYRTISPGSILVAKNTLLPEPLGLENDLSKRGWTRVKNNPDRQELGKELAHAGWSFFFMAGAIRATAFGFDRPRMIEAALKRLIAIVRRQKCNCLEIDAIATRSFWGMPYISMSAHSRHIQNGLVFDSHTV
jgi:hypothetical protein